MKKIITFLMALCVSISLWAGNTITYTASNKLNETTSSYSSGLHTIAFGASFRSHTFANGVGTITFSGDVTSIGEYAFYYCSGLTSITIPESVTSIGRSAFDGCSGLTEITIPNSVISIGNYAFFNCSGLTSVTIPGSVTSIGDAAFSRCSGLTEIVVESDNIVYDSRNNCNATIETATNTLIAGCQNTTIPESVTSIGSWAFEGCSGLTSITIPNSVTSIGSWAFYGCSGLTSITIPNSVTSIGRSAFDGCSGLTEITIPNSVISIGSYAFCDCSGLTSVTIPGSVTNIDQGAFYGCSGLMSLIIGEGVISIGSYAFKSCRGLTSITAEGVRPAVCESDCFNNVDKSIPLYVPAGSVAAYRAAEGWRDFTNILPIPSPVGNIVVASSDETMGAAYGSGTYDNGTETKLYAIPADGYKFTGWNDGVTTNPRTITVAGDSTFTAMFAPEVTEAAYEVNVSSVNPAWGSASAQEAVVLTAVPEAGYKFLMWSDGNTDNPRAIILTDDINLMAIFMPDAATEVSAATAPESDLRKELIQGKVYITRDGSTYTILGTRVK